MRLPTRQECVENRDKVYCGRFAQKSVRPMTNNTLQHSLSEMFFFNLGFYLGMCCYFPVIWLVNFV